MPAQTVLTQGAGLGVADGIALAGFLGKQLFAGLGCSFLLLHFFCDFMIIGAKVVKKCDTEKSFQTIFLNNYSFIHISR